MKKQSENIKKIDTWIRENKRANIKGNKRENNDRFERENKEKMPPNGTTNTSFLSTWNYG